MNDITLPFPSPVYGRGCRSEAEAGEGAREPRQAAQAAFFLLRKKRRQVRRALTPTLSRTRERG